MADEATKTEEPVAENDPLRQPILDLLSKELGDDVVGSELVAGDDLWIRVHRAVWRRAVEVCRDRLGFTYFCFLSGIDWKANPALLGEKEWDPPEDSEEAAAEPPTESEGWTTGVAGGDTRFQVFARLYSIANKVGVTLKADLDEDDPRIDSLVPLFRGADWHERETWEMYGFTFDGHPKLRHLYLPGEFEGYPLRKDFPLLARLVKPWPGLVDVEPMPGEAVEDPEAASAAAEEG